MRTITLFALFAFAVCTALPGPAAAQSKFFSFERGTDRPGNDIANMPIRNAADCSFKCQESNVCRAFTFVRPGVFGPNGICFLKAPAPRAVGNNCCISGLRKGTVILD